MAEEKNLIPINTNMVALFTEGGLGPILNAIKKKVDEFKPDIKTVGGREEVASFAYKIAQSKTFIDKAGKKLISAQKAEIKLVDIERKRSRDFLDEQRDRARQPLTDYEEAENKRIEEEAARLEFEADHTEALELHSSWLKERELEELKAKIAREEEEKREQEEAARIKKEQKEREELLKKEAAAVAEKKAEETIEAEKEKAIRFEIAAKAEKERAVREAKEEAEAKAAKVEAARVAEEIVQKAKKEAERKAAEKKAAHKSHRHKINREILKGFKSIGILEGKGNLIINAIINKQIPHVTINY